MERNTANAETKTDTGAFINLSSDFFSYVDLFDQEDHVEKDWNFIEYTVGLYGNLDK